MANIDDQLKVTLQLAQATERIAKTLASVEDSYKSQLDIVTKLGRALDDLKVTNTVNQINDLTGAVRELSESLDTVGNLSEENLDRLAKEAANATNEMSSLGARTAELGKNIGAVSASGVNGFKDISDEVERGIEEMDQFGSSMDGVAKKMSGKFAMAGGLAVTAVTGIVQGFKNVVGLSKGVIGTLTGIASWGTNVAASLISIPFKIFTGIIDFAAQANHGMSELRQAIENVRKEFGDLRGPAAASILTTTKTLKGFSDTGLSSWRVFGNFAERMNYIREVATAMGPIFSNLHEEFTNNGGAILAFQKGLGIANEEMKTLGARAMTHAKPLGEIMLDISKQSLELGKAFDIDQKLIARATSKAMTDVKHFGQLTVKEIGRAVVYSKKLGVELENITGILDAFETFDSAAENAAKLSQSFGVQVDAFKLMEAQSPDEQIDMLRKQFKQANVDASSFNRQQLKLLASTTGLDEATAKQVFSMKNQGASLEDIKKKSEGAEKKQLSQAEAMSKLADSIERLVKEGPAQKGGFFDQFIGGFFRGIQASKEFRETIYGIKYSLRAAMYEGVKLGRTFVKIFPGVKDFLGGLRDFFSPKAFGRFFADIRIEFEKFFGAVASGKHSLPELMKILQDRFLNFFNSRSAAGNQILEGFKTFTKSMSSIIVQAIPYIAEQLGHGLQMLASFVSNPKAVGLKLMAPAEGTLGFLQEIFVPIINSLREAWNNPVFKKGLDDFVTSLGTRLKELFESETFKKVASAAMKAMIGALIAPSVLQPLGLTLMAGIAKSAAGSLLGSGGAAAFKKVGPAIASKLGPALSTGVSTAFKTSLGGAAAATTGVLASGIVGIFAGKAIADSLSNAVDETGKAIGESSKSMFETVTADISAAEKLAQLKREKELFAQNKKAIEDRNFIVKFWEEMGKDESTTQAAAIKRQEEFINQQEQLLQKQLQQEQKAQAKQAKKRGNLSFLGATSVEDASKKLDTLDALSKKLNSAGFDVQKTLESVREKFANVNFNVIDEKGTADIEKSSETFSRLSSVFENLENVTKSLAKLSSVKSVSVPNEVFTSMGDVAFHLSGLATNLEAVSVDKLNDTIRRTDAIAGVFESIGELPKTIKAATKVVGTNAFAPAIEAVHKMTDLANELEDALSEGAINKLDVKTKLKRVATSIGLGAKGRYTVKNKSVNITLNLQVSMNVDDVEKVMIMRKKSIIRDRLNWVINNPSERGGPDIPETKDGVLNPIGPR